jgi:hypothetical protein
MKHDIEKGFTEDKTHRRCNQVKCGYFINGGCKSCSDCGAESFVIQKDCKKCLSCEGVQDELRWNDDKRNKSDLKEKTEELLMAQMMLLMTQRQIEKLEKELKHEEHIEQMLIAKR